MTIQNTKQEKIKMSTHETGTMDAAPSARITLDPDRYGGVPCVSQGCWPITHILEKLADGTSVAQLTLEDICLALEAA